MGWGLGRGELRGKNKQTTAAWEKWKKSSADPEGGGGVGGQEGPNPPGKSQVIWGSIGNKQLNPLPGKSWTPELEKFGPLRNLKK